MLRCNLIIIEKMSLDIFKELFSLSFLLSLFTLCFLVFSLSPSVDYVIAEGRKGDKYLEIVPCLCEIREKEENKILADKNHSDLLLRRTDKFTRKHVATRSENYIR